MLRKSMRLKAVRLLGRMGRRRAIENEKSNLKSEVRIREADLWRAISLLSSLTFFDSG